MHSRIYLSSICLCNSSFSSSLIQVTPTIVIMASKLQSPSILLIETLDGHLYVGRISDIASLHFERVNDVVTFVWCCYSTKNTWCSCPTVSTIVFWIFVSTLTLNLTYSKTLPNLFFAWIHHLKVIFAPEGSRIWTIGQGSLPCVTGCSYACSIPSISLLEVSTFSLNKPGCTSNYKWWPPERQILTFSLKPSTPIHQFSNLK